MFDKLFKNEDRGIIDHTFNVLYDNQSQDKSKEYKEYRRQWNENPKNHVVGEYPIHLDIETTTNCNLRCNFCFHAFDPPKKEIMEYKMFYEIIEEITGGKVKSVKLQYRGEPMTDHRMVEFVNATKDAGVLEVMFNTNANLLIPRKIEQMRGLDKVICSIEGHDGVLYNMHRINGNFQQVVTNLKYIEEYKRLNKLTRPVVRVQMVKTPEAEPYLKEYVKFWKDKADVIATDDMLDFQDDEIDRTVLEEWACPQLWQRMVVLADGDILPCCKSLIGGNKKQTVLGSLRSGTIKMAWKSPTMTRLRDMHKDGRSHEIDMCARCSIRKDYAKKVK